MCVKLQFLSLFHVNVFILRDGSMEKLGAAELARRNDDIQFYQIQFTRFGYQWLFHQGNLTETGKQSGSKHWARLYHLSVKAKMRLDSGEILWKAYLIPDDVAEEIMKEEEQGLFRGPVALGLADQ